MTASRKAIIREMDSEELEDRARELFNMKRPWTPAEAGEYEACKKQYKQITGLEMFPLQFLIESI